MDFEYGLAEQVDTVFSNNPEIRDHRKKHSWLTGSLGDPYSGIWFLAVRRHLYGYRFDPATNLALDRGCFVLAVLIAVSGVFEPIDTAPTRDPNLPP